MAVTNWKRGLTLIYVVLWALLGLLAALAYSFDGVQTRKGWALWAAFCIILPLAALLAWRSARPLASAGALTYTVAVFHILVQGVAWSDWNQVSKPGVVAALWPVVSFPAFPLYRALWGDRNMFHMSEPLWYGNSVLWGLAAGMGYLVMTSRTWGRRRASSNS